MPKTIPIPPTSQRIVRLTPLVEALAAISARVAPVAAVAMPAEAATGHVLVADLVAVQGYPRAATALIDGFAVHADETADAGAYAAAPLSSPPRRVDAGDPMPPGADAVAPLDTVDMSGGLGLVSVPVAPGEGALAAGADAQAGQLLRRAGEILRASDTAVASAIGIAQVHMRRPRISLLPARAHPATQASCGWVAQMLSAGGASVTHSYNAAALEAALVQSECDAVVIVGGTGTGHADAAVATLRRVGEVVFHGVGLSPGETAAFGLCDGRPVLVLPERLDATWAAWLAIGQHFLAQLTGRQDTAVTISLTLTQKITSAVGIADVVPLRRDNETAMPLSRGQIDGHIPLAALSHADAWLMVPADSEGYPAGTLVSARPLP
jgi:molybdopterin molybdotransferase